MFFRRKKSQGFDWHTYVRTTIKLRRDQRRAKIEEIGRVAANQAKAAGGAAVQGVVQVADSGWRASISAWRATIAQPAVALPVTLCGLAATASGAYRWLSSNGADHDALLPLTIGIVLLVAVAPLALAPVLQRRSTRPARPEGQMPTGLGARLNAILAARVAASATSGLLPSAAVGAVVLGLGWFAWGGALPGIPAAASLPQTLTSKLGSSEVLEGRATVLSGEMVRLQGRLLHLAGIEAPDRQQTCIRTTKQTWKCGEAAQKALERLARAEAFRCVTQGGPDAQGRIAANCTVDGRDVSAELVKDGHVFAAASYFGGYGAQERDAKRASAGLWSGEAVRPSDFRSKSWDAAKAAAPNGCPIKGQVSSGRKIYLVPWAPDYASANVRTERGERWFCDEAEAVTAGFKPSQTSRQATAR